MLLSELILEDVIRTDLDAANKWEAIEELIDLLISAHELRLNDRAEVFDAVMTREKSLSTGLERGLAVPHGVADCVGDVIASLGVSKKGIPFDSLDGKPARLIVLLVIPKGAFPRHVKTLAGIARLARSDNLRERIIHAERPGEIMDAIYELDASTGAAP